MADRRRAWHGAVAGLLAAVLAIATEAPHVSAGNPSTLESAEDTMVAPGLQIYWRGRPALLFLQETLTLLGYAPGTVDGAYGPRTRGAIEGFQEDRGLEPNGAPSRALFRSLIEARLIQAGQDAVPARVTDLLSQLENRIAGLSRAAPRSPGSPPISDSATGASPAASGSADIGALFEDDPFPGEDEAAARLAALPPLPDGGARTRPRPGSEGVLVSRSPADVVAATSGGQLEVIVGLLEREADAGRLVFCDALADCRAEADAAAAAAAGRGAVIPPHSETILHLALDFSFSESGREVDEPVAARLFRAAAEDGHPWAQFAFGFLNLIGEGIGPDLAEAERWLELAAAADVEAARRMLKIVRSVP